MKNKHKSERLRDEFENYSPNHIQNNIGLSSERLPLLEEGNEVTYPLIQSEFDRNKSGNFEIENNQRFLKNMTSNQYSFEMSVMGKSITGGVCNQNIDIFNNQLFDNPSESIINRFFKENTELASLSSMVEHHSLEQKNLAHDISINANIDFLNRSLSVDRCGTDLSMVEGTKSENIIEIAGGRFSKSNTEWLPVDSGLFFKNGDLVQHIFDEGFIKGSVDFLRGSISGGKFEKDLVKTDGIGKPNFDTVNHCFDKKHCEATTNRFFKDGTEWSAINSEVPTNQNILVQSSSEINGFFSTSVDFLKSNITTNEFGADLSPIDKIRKLGFNSLDAQLNDNLFEVTGNRYFKDSTEWISDIEGASFGNETLEYSSLNDDEFVNAHLDIARGGLLFNELKTDLNVIEGVSHQYFEIGNQQFEDNCFALTDPNRFVKESLITESRISKNGFVNVRSNFESMSTSLGEVLTNDQLQSVIEHGMNKAENFNSLVSDSDIKTEAYFSMSTGYSFDNVNITCNYLFLIGGDFTAIQDHFGDNVIEVDGDKVIEIDGDKYVKL